LAIVHSYLLLSTFLKPLGTPVVYLLMTREKGKKFNKKGDQGTLLGFNPDL
jgi:hypothetical protein